MAARWLPDSLRERLRRLLRREDGSASTSTGAVFTAERPITPPARERPAAASVASPPLFQPPGAAEPASLEPPHGMTPQATPAGPEVRVHDERLDGRSGPVALSPSQALTLAQEGPEALRRDRPRAQ